PPRPLAPRRARRCRPGPAVPATHLRPAPSAPGDRRRHVVGAAGAEPRRRALMPHYLDTSAFLKLVVEEPDSAALRTWAEADDRELFSCDLLRTEALRTARRHSTDALREARARLDAVTIIEVSTAICERAADLDPAILRSLDALH